MITSHLEVRGEPADDERRNCTLLGLVSGLMSEAPSHSHLPWAHVSTVLIPAISHRQVKVYFNEDGDPVGYVVWAHLADDVERRAMQTGQFSLHESEWNEGNTLWVLDLLALPGHLKYMLRDMRDSLFASDEAVRYLRIKHNRRMAKEIGREERFGFFAAGRRQVA
ncbi:toxin-activating lysine-acyltransferase [Piscinibacter terrae]|uniref:RTX toxin-activating lysine-acyltransferase n=1 Tax=Piscinibacter terrae TaxID=2496871 RepID=A0A3N7HS84_9BURK|nr:toxin-activating lysine-acyltransferase [Albitalea terrae]RQP23681.1 toxin-activating lysine-acyltransferase [Albitalea terrae]